MCGIAGILSGNKGGERGLSDKKELVGKMLQSIAHRGPDELNIETAGPLSVGTVRLSLLEPGPAGSQPLFGAAGNWLLAYNGEIFNHTELRAQLPARRYRGNSDTETLLYGLSHEGISFVNKCNGFFAFAAFDIRKRKLYLCRDRLGIKPLYWSYVNGQLFFASEMKALFAGGVFPRYNPSSVQYCLTHYWVNGPRTPFHGIERVPPGFFLEIDLPRPDETVQNKTMQNKTVQGKTVQDNTAQDETVQDETVPDEIVPDHTVQDETVQDNATVVIKKIRWHAPQDYLDTASQQILETRTRAQLATDLKQLLTAAVSLRLKADAPLGVLCSGGLDSSIITAIAASLHPHRLPAFCATFPEFPEYDEGKWAQSVCTHTGAELISVPVTKEEWKAAFVSCVYHFEYPLVHESAVALSLIAKKAKSMNIKGLLSGEGADELFGGYGSRHLAVRKAFQPFHGQGDSAALQSHSAAPQNHSASQSHSTAQSHSAAPLPERKAPFSNIFSSYPLFTPSVSYDEEVIEELGSSYNRLPAARIALEAAIASDLYNFLPHGLNRLDKNMMQHSVEIREPFLENEVVRFALNTPLEARILPELKGILRDAGRHLLPSEIINRPKSGFNFPSHFFFGEADATVLQKGILKEMLQVPDKQWKETLAQTGERSLMRLWSAEVWARIFLLREKVETVQAKVWG